MHRATPLPLSLAVFSAAFFAEALPAQEAQTPPSAAAEGSVMKPRFLPGKIYTFAAETGVALAGPGEDVSAAARRFVMNHESRFLTANRDGGEPGVRVTASTEKLVLEINAGAKQVRYDSSDPATKDSALAMHFEGATRRSVVMDLDPDGKVVGSTEVGGGGPATPLPGLPQFGPDQLKQLVVSVLQGFPKDRVAPGQEWTQKGKRSLGELGEIDFEINYRYVRDEAHENADCALIEYTGGIKGDVAVTGVQPGAGQGKMGFEGRQMTGRFYFDKALGIPRFSEQTLNVNASVPNPDRLQSGTIQVPMRQRIVIKLLSLRDA
ncbi:MAG: hypothetical protein KDM91_11310 [Verrucomicrobiae bacterium]|nr:hypothetical protein [Verrucomicrobiae bacterium]